MKHVVKHDLDDATAKTVAVKAMESYTVKLKKYEPEVDWTSDTRAQVRFAVSGFKLSGQIELEPKKILLDLSVPLPLRLFKKQAIEIIDREIRTWIDKAKQGELE